MSQLPEPEVWSPETIAEFYLNNAFDAEGYRWAVQEALSLGVDPTKLDPAHLSQERPWQNPALYMDARVQLRQS